MHTVNLQPFLMCRTECTQEAWDRVGGSDDRKLLPIAGFPIESVSWRDCAVWCRKAGLRLPSEAEWEYACRAGTATAYCFGDEDSDLGEYAWYDGNSRGKTYPVGQRKPNAFGLYDMHGNVHEWCQDWYVGNYSRAPSDGSAYEGGGSQRMVRGGYWLSLARGCRSAFRFMEEPSCRDQIIGFRPAASLP